MIKNKIQRKANAIAIECYLKNFLIGAYAKDVTEDDRITTVRGIRYEISEFDSIEEANYYLDTVTVKEHAYGINLDFLKDGEHAIYAVYDTLCEGLIKNQREPIAYFCNDEEISKAKYEELYKERVIIEAM